MSQSLAVERMVWFEVPALPLDAEKHLNHPPPMNRLPPRTFHVRCQGKTPRSFTTQAGSGRVWKSGLNMRMKWRTDATGKARQAGAGFHG